MRDTLLAVREFLATRFPSSRTVETYLRHIETFLEARSGQPAELCPSRIELEAFLARPRGDGARRVATSRNQALSALRAFVVFGMRDLGWTEDPTAKIVFMREPPRDPAVLSTEEVRALFVTTARVARRGSRSRDLAMLALLSQSALRVHELVALNVNQIDAGSATLLAVKGKGGTVHDLPLHPSTLTLVQQWLADRAPRASPEQPALFLAPTGKRLSKRAVQQLFVRLRTAMGTAKKITPHTMRHSAATIALFLGTDLVTVAGLLRHADLNTTRRYIHLVDAQRREAVRRLATSTIPLDLLPPVSAEPAPITAVPPSSNRGLTENPQASAISATQAPCADHDIGAAKAE